MKTIEEMKSLVEAGKTQLLALDYVNNHIGQRISTIYFGYAHQVNVDNFVIGAVKSEYDLACERTGEAWKGFKNQAEYWESFMKPERLQETKDTLCLIAEDGRNTFIRFYKENGGVAACSDIDRFVSFVEE